MSEIDVRSAVSSAYKYLEFLKNELGTEIDDVRLEEVEQTGDGNYWLITLGYNVLVKPQFKIAMMGDMNQKYEREYKVFDVDAKTGDVIRMKIRTP